MDLKQLRLIFFTMIIYGIQNGPHILMHKK